MPTLTDSDLRDPMPPVPGERERALVATRAHQLGRRRRLVRGASALAVVAAVSVSVAALTAGGSSDPSGSARVEAASPRTDTAPAPAPTTLVTTPAPVVPGTAEPAPDSTPATAQDTPEPGASTAGPATFTVSGTIGNYPDGVTVTLTFQGAGATFSTVADASGHFSVGGVAPGTYDVLGDWVDSTQTSTHAERLGRVTVDGDSSVSLTFL